MDLREGSVGVEESLTQGLSSLRKSLPGRSTCRTGFWVCPVAADPPDIRPDLRFSIFFGLEPKPKVGG